MNFADIQTAWQSPQNGPSPAQREIMKQRFVADLTRRRRCTRIFLLLVVTALSVITARFCWFAFTSSVHAGRSGFDFRAEWGSGLLLVLPWIAAVVLAWQLARFDRAQVNCETTLRAAVEAALEENRLHRKRYKLIALLHAVLLIVLPVVVWQLHATGKAGREILVPAFVVWPLISAGILLAMRWHDRAKLRPRQRELEQLLADYSA